jgi:hypothetical protein
VTIRVFTDKGSEHLAQFKVRTDGITNIRQDEVLKIVGQSNILQTAIVQIEAETTNYNATWYAVDKRTGHIATDHFTGG